MFLQARPHLSNEIAGKLQVVRVAGSDGNRSWALQVVRDMVLMVIGSKSYRY